MTEAPRVFIIQQPSTYSHEHKRFVAKYDLSPARKFGKLVLVLPPGNIFEDRLGQSLAHMRTVFASYATHDYLLAIGDPVAIAAGAIMARAKSGGIVKMLKWDRHARAYVCFPISDKVGEIDEKADSNGT